jgi:hypothetical protein
VNQKQLFRNRLKGWQRKAIRDYLLDNRNNLKGFSVGGVTADVKGHYQFEGWAITQSNVYAIARKLQFSFKGSPKKMTRKRSTGASVQVSRPRPGCLECDRMKKILATMSQKLQEIVDAIE